MLLLLLGCHLEDDTVYLDVSVGHDAACAIRAADHGVDCWGSASPGPSVVVDTLDIETAHACGLDEDGSGVCWAWDDWVSASAVEPPEGAALSVAVTSSGTCWLGIDGLATCTRSDLQPPEVAFDRVTGGLSHACGRTESGQARCWGNDVAGQVSRIDGVEQVLSIEAGVETTCIVDEEGLLCVGGRDGQGVLLEDWSLDGSFVDVAVSSTAAAIDTEGKLTARREWTDCWPGEEEIYRRVGLSEREMCLITDEGRIECWAILRGGEEGERCVTGAPEDVFQAAIEYGPQGEPS